MPQVSEAGDGCGGEGAGERVACELLLLFGKLNSYVLESRVVFSAMINNADYERSQECGGEFEDGRYFLRGESDDPVCVRCEERRLKA